MAQPSSGSAALQTFLSGQGDVLLDYESDALYAKSKGEAIDIITPPQTILIENPIAVTKSASAVGEGVRHLLALPRRPEGVGPAGLPPGAAVGGGAVPLPQAQDACSPIDKFGGWTAVNTKFFDPQTGIVAKDEQSLGVSTASG